ncbi:CapA family protein [Actinophytocola sp.]|uniref:CapA family protein n=1 Tax=Actinophytocola sp. TaxID=1872138 RepID=UPI003D6B5E6B
MILVTVFLAGDVMTGRGVDQVLPHPGDPRLREPHVRDARAYVVLAERVNGRIPRPVGFAWPWGAARRALDELAPDVRLINLETSITSRGKADSRKRIHYRMSPENTPCLVEARPDVCVLANNHVLDFGVQGLEDTVDSLDEAGIAAVGAGSELARAARPAIVPVHDRGRVVVFAFGDRSSGVPRDWAATWDRAGVNRLPDLSDATADDVIAQVRQAKGLGDIVVASIHWGSNWGYEVPAEQVAFARRLVDGGVDVVHGHSSHHPRPIEVYRDRLILYGCGDLINDYEGISGYEAYRDDLRVLYLATIDPVTGALARLRLLPMRAWRMRLQHATPDDADHVRRVLDEVSRPFGSRVEHAADGMLAVGGASS